ncbi:hypothetical protein [Streptomyces griseomycini]|uniref:Uncharacterized protein n=1 Tax=Streptomyces griseomycini TaxID=66895 RepID=A0A7W7PSQ3_9ACTN|nr:hypothetical protein [Streptomyces griseomycini]MBB4900440.1 hypothetical protein [Streptomyces griseomycini]GGQ25086.1 hypothetical protein GCM10010266_55450 [Streptomyces griseomycini]GGR38434.1 hypothetical protein GCM10015536_50170 [Streptomyces griseomycini]
MTDQPYQGYDPYDGNNGYHGNDGYDPYRQQQAQPQAWPGQQAYDDPYDAQQYTQQWQGQTWETSVQPPVPAAPSVEETAYMPSQGDARYVGHTGYGEAAAYGAPPGPMPEPAPAASAGPAAPPAPAPAPSPAGDGPAYGPATLAGNARVTDAQRARAEGRSPIIEPGMQPAVLTALLGLLLAGGAALGTYALLVPLVVLQGVTAAGWFRLNGMWPARQGIALGFLGALAADAALLVSDRSTAAILGTLGVWVLLSLVLQLRSHADPDERMYGLMATVAAAALAIAAGGYLAADADAVTVGAVAVAAAAVARALPLPTPASVVVALLVAAGAGFAAGAATGTGASGALLGAGAAVCALIGHRVASYDYPSRFVHFTAGVALPLSAAAPAVYVLGRVFA